MLTLLLFVAVCFLAYSNGANDNFKGVASLFGSRTASYRTCLTWATVTTLAGSVCAIFLAQGLLKKFSGRGLVPDELVGSELFLVCVALGGGLTVILATVSGFPISTTHGLTGALVGAGLVVVGAQVNFAALGKGFVLPLVLSPLVAVALGGTLYVLLRSARLRLGVSKEWCVCVGQVQRVVPVPQPTSAFALPVVAAPVALTVGTVGTCSERYVGSFFGVTTQRLMDNAHFLSAGVVSFARGLNDTPKIAALLLVARALDIRWGLLAVAAAIAIGGWLNARKVAETMSHKITQMNAGQGFAANLSTGLLVTVASLFSLPVSTTHVSVGSLFGLGLVSRQVNLKAVSGIVLSWVVTLPCAAALSALAYWLGSALIRS
jgi:PiT family inorganic phosphate transporter